MIEVLRLGHRRRRDPRLTTHVCLTARALGADRVTVAEKDPDLERTVRDVVERFGGPFEIRTDVPWRRVIEEARSRGAFVVHLTMYGVPVGQALTTVDRVRDLLVVVGSEKVPGDLYRVVDANVAIGNQPHSEVAALAIFLDRWTEGRWVDKEFNGRVRIVPNPRGKTITED